jgi:hypothetical protein
VAAVAAGPARADLVTFAPDPADLYDLPHQYYVTWGIQVDAEDPSLLLATAASLVFKNIYNWDDDENVLYVRLLDTAPLGVTTYWDAQGGGDNFQFQGIRLVTLRDLPDTPQTIVYEFEPDEVATLTDYLRNDGRIAIAFDPDCHFFNDGVSLDLAVASSVIPEPASIALMAVGLAGMAFRLRRGR